MVMRQKPVAWEEHPWGPRKWQRDAFPRIVDAIRHSRGECKPVVVAWMGAGKSVLLTELARHSSLTAPEMTVLIIAPTQDLVEQLAKTVHMRCPQVGRFYGRVKEPDSNVIVCCYASLPTLAKVLEARGRQVGLLIADECHQTQADVVREAIQEVGPKVMIGFSATPFRGDGQSLELFTDVVYQYTMGDGLRDGVLVPFDWQHPPMGTSDSMSPAELDELCIEMIRRQAPDGPGVVSAKSIADAEAYAEKLSAAGIEALAIHSRLRPAEQERRIELLRTGGVRALVHINMLAEGVDFPWLRWLCLRSERGKGAKGGGPRMFLQEIGRVGRVLKEPDQWGTKEKGTILDPRGQYFTRNLQNDPMLGETVREERGMGFGGGGEGGGQGLAVERKVRIHPVGPVQFYAISLRRTLEAFGLPVRARYETLHERGQPQSSSQAMKLHTAFRRTEHLLPPGHGEDVRWLLRQPLDRGSSSDLLSTLWAVRKAGGWPEGAHVDRLDRKGAVDLFSGRAA